MILDYFNIPSEISDNIEQYALSADVKWRLQPETVSDTGAEYSRKKYNFKNKIAGKTIVEKYSFHQILFRNEGDVRSDVFEETGLLIIKPLQDYVALEIINRPIVVSRVVMNLFCYYSSDAIAMPHCDSYDDNAISCLYYVNNSSGKTVFFNEDSTIAKQVSPKKGTGGVFKSNMLHAGSYQREQTVPRVVINFLFKCV